MRARRSFIVAATMAVGAALALPLTAAAHALPQSAIPPEGAEVQTAPKVVEITFGETPDPKLSSITVINSSGVSVDAGPTVVVPGHPLELEVPLRPIGNGVYTVTWKTVSETDGHLATGAYAFGVGEVRRERQHARQQVGCFAAAVCAGGRRAMALLHRRDGDRGRSIDMPDCAARHPEVRHLNARRIVAGRRTRGRRHRRSATRGCGRELRLPVLDVARDDRCRARRGHRGNRHGCRRHVDCTFGRIACRSRPGGPRRSDLDVGGCRCEPRGSADAGGDQPRCAVGPHPGGRGLDWRAVDPPPRCTGPTVGRQRSGSAVLNDRRHRHRDRRADRHVPRRHRNRIDRPAVRHRLRGPGVGEGGAVSCTGRPRRDQSLRQRTPTRRPCCADCVGSDRRRS